MSEIAGTTHRWGQALGHGVHTVVALGSPVSLAEVQRRWWGRANFWLLRSSDQYLCKVSVANHYEITCFPNFASWFFFWKSARLSPEPSAGAQHPPAPGQNFPWGGCRQSTVLPCSLFYPLARGLWGSSCKALRDLWRKKNFLIKEKFHVKKNISSKITSNLGKKGHFLVEKQYSHIPCWKQ